MTPTIRLTYGPDAPIGTNVSADNDWILNLINGVYHLTVQSLRTVQSVSVFVGLTPPKTLWFGEHLGMQIDVPGAGKPAGTVLNYATEFPGPLQMPVLLAADATKTTLLGALDWPVKCEAMSTSLKLTWPGPLPPGVPHLFEFVAADITGIGRPAAYTLLDKYRVACRAWNKGVLDTDHGMIDVQLQDHENPLQHLARMWADYGHQFDRFQCWGQMSDTQCCEPKYGIHERYAGLRTFGDFLDDIGSFLGFYMRPDRGDGVPDDQWLYDWRKNLWDDRFDPVFYVDTAGFRNMQACYENWADFDLIEGATMDLPNPALVSNCLSGGGFSLGGGTYPKTLPDGTPHPQNPMPWITSAPWVGKYLMRDRTMVLGSENCDFYFDGLYWTTVNGQRKEWMDHLWKSCLMLDLLMSPRDPGNTTVQAIIKARNDVGWLTQDREWLDIGLWKDRNTGKRYIAQVDPIRILETP